MSSLGPGMPGTGGVMGRSCPTGPGCHHPSWQDRAMDGGLAGVVLAAGAGTRLRPLTLLRPKVLCPVGNVPLIDLALARLGSVGSVAVNVHHGRAMLDAHLDPGVHRSYEESLLGTAGALRSEEHTSELQSLMRISYAVFCLKKKTSIHTTPQNAQNQPTKPIN